MYLMKVRIYFTQNNLLNSYEIKSFVSCGMYGQYQSNLAVLKCCAVDFNYTFVPCCRSTASWISQRGGALGMNRGGTVKQELMPVVDAFVKWMKRGINRRMRNWCLRVQAVLYLGTNLCITCLQAVGLGKQLKPDYSKSNHQFSLPHFWMLDLKSLWSGKCEHSQLYLNCCTNVSETSGLGVSKRTSQDLSFNSLCWKMGNKG